MKLPKSRADKFLELDKKLWDIFRIIDEINDIDFSIADRSKFNRHILSIKEHAYKTFKISVIETQTKEIK